MNKPKAVSLFTLLSITLLFLLRYTHACLSLTQERLGEQVHLLERLGEQVHLLERLGEQSCSPQHSRFTQTAAHT